MVDIYHLIWILMNHGLVVRLWFNNEQDINTLGIL
jgi:hypothetical protein